MTRLSFSLDETKGRNFFASMTTALSTSTRSMDSIVRHFVNSRTVPPSPPPITSTFFTCGCTAIGTWASISW